MDIDQTEGVGVNDLQQTEYLVEFQVDCGWTTCESGPLTRTDQFRRSSHDCDKRPTSPLQGIWQSH